MWANPLLPSGSSAPSVSYSTARMRDGARNVACGPEPTGFTKRLLFSHFGPKLKSVYPIAAQQGKPLSPLPGPSLLFSGHPFCRREAGAPDNLAERHFEDFAHAERGFETWIPFLAQYPSHFRGNGRTHFVGCQPVALIEKRLDKR